MGEVFFYHLTATPLERTVPDLVEKTLARGWKAVLRIGSAAGLAELDRLLWTFRQDSFLPHGTSETPFPERQPVYLTCSDEIPNAADILILIEGARSEPAEMARFARTCVLFDGSDPEALARARDDWRVVTEAGLAAVYWAQDDGRWVDRKRVSPGM